MRVSKPVVAIRRGRSRRESSGLRSRRRDQQRRNRKPGNSDRFAPPLTFPVPIRSLVLHLDASTHECIIGTSMLRTFGAFTMCESKRSIRMLVRVAMLCQQED